MHEQESIRFVSRYEMKQILKSGVDLEEYAIISVNDTDDEYSEMLESLKQSTCSEFSLSMFPDTDDGTGMSSLQAQCILSFIIKNSNKKFLVHCFAGVSRSGAIAKFINEFLERGIFYLEDYMGYNRHCFNQLLSVAGMSLTAHYTELERQDRKMMGWEVL